MTAVFLSLAGPVHTFISISGSFHALIIMSHDYISVGEWRSGVVQVSHKYPAGQSGVVQKLAN